MTASAPTKETILVVDDEASIRRILETRLSMIGYNVVTACDGTEALACFQECEPDLVVLDVMMPGLDGWELLRRLKSNPRTRHLPVILATAIDDEDEIAGVIAGLMKEHFGARDRAAATLPRATPLSRFPATFARPSATASSLMSKRQVSMPLMASTWAMPCPMVPAPRTAARWMEAARS